MRHKIFEYSFTASLPGIISVKGFFLFTLFRYQLIYIERDSFLFFLFKKKMSDGHLKLEIAGKKKKLSKGSGSVF